MSAARETAGTLPAVVADGKSTDNDSTAPVSPASGERTWELV